MEESRLKRLRTLFFNYRMVVLWVFYALEFRCVVEHGKILRINP